MLDAVNLPVRITLFKREKSETPSPLCWLFSTYFPIYMFYFVLLWIFINAANNTTVGGIVYLRASIERSYRPLVFISFYHSADISAIYTLYVFIHSFIHLFIYLFILILSCIFILFVLIHSFIH